MFFSVEIDCRDIFRPGQLSVALSRVTSSEGLRVINFHDRHVMTPPRTVTDFMESMTTHMPTDQICCQKYTVLLNTEIHV